MELEAELLKVMKKEELEEALNKKIEEFHGFLTRDVALKLIAADRNLLKKEINRIADIHPGARGININGTVAEVFPARIYKSGKRSRIIRIKDGSGETGIMLWNDDADGAAGIKSGDEVEVGNAYEKDGELSLGYSGYFRITKRAGFTPVSEIKEMEGKRIHVRSFISRLVGRAGSGYMFVISDGKQEIECQFGYGDQRFNGLAEGREVVIENGLVDKGRLKLDDKTRILLKKFL